jgi:hypothetical protein
VYTVDESCGRRDVYRGGCASRTHRREIHDLHAALAMHECWHVRPFERLTGDLLTEATGGANPGYKPADNALGRVGPGTNWKWLGNYYTPEALAHDNAMRAGIAQGESKTYAWVRALPELPAAIGSYFRARFDPGPNDMQFPS